MSRNATRPGDRGPSPSYLIGADIGGTFTDLVLVTPGGEVASRKVSSTSEDYAQAIIIGLAGLLKEHGVEARELAALAHGTTVATNAILEHRGARTGLLTTRGFRDVLEIGRLRMPRLYDPEWTKPDPLVERDLRFEVPERVDAKGECILELDEEAARRAIRELVAQKIESLAICFLHAYVNPEHERRVAELAAELSPELDISTSSGVLPEIKEYERMSTTVINAYVRPVVRQYLESLTSSLRRKGVSAPLWVMQSNGGLMGVQAAAARPVHIVESGPAAGVVGALDLATRQGLSNLITFDMGGTTAKVSLIEEGRLSVAPEYEVGAGISIGSRLLRGGGYILRVPAIDIAEVGAGGGSIVWLDTGGSLRVGPRSAGAQPGPVAYDRGGVEPTLTDANIVLGYIASLAGGSLPLDAARAKEVFRVKVAEPLGLSLEEAAFGARRVGNSNMVQAVRAVSTERGRDPRDFVLFAFGGNGPVHAADVAAEMGMSRIVVPPAAGVFSALGLCLANVAQHFVRTHIRELGAVNPSALEKAWAALDDEARLAMRTEDAAGSELVLRRLADLRYVGQSNELMIPLEGERVDRVAIEGLARDFAAEHRRAYGHEAAGSPIELVSLRLVAMLGVGLPTPPSVVGDADGARGPTVDAAPPSRPSWREAYFGREHGWCTVPAYKKREDFNTRRTGPCLLDLYDATVVVPPGWSAELDGDGNIVSSAAEAFEEGGTRG